MVLYHFLAVLLFVGFGIFILVSPPTVMQLNKEYKTILGILLVVYGLYRAYKAYGKLTQKEEEEYDDEE